MGFTTFLLPFPGRLFFYAGCLALGLAVCPPGQLRAASPVTNNLVLWLDAGNGLAPDGSTWTDLSGQGHHATALSGQAPAVVPNALNGLPAAQFKGAQAMSIAGQVLNDPLNYSIVAVVTDATAATQAGRGTLVDPTSPFILSGIASSTNAAVYQNLHRTVANKFYPPS